MKKIIASIIVLISIISIQTPTFASNEPIFERLLDLNHGIEEYDLQLAHLDEMYFFDQNLNNMHSEFQKANENIKKEIIMYYRQGRFTNYQTQGIVRAHKNFVYYTNQIFTHMRYKELDPHYADADGQILDNYRKARSSYNKIKQVINTRY
jgi:hypothetical protein